MAEGTSGFEAYDVANIANKGFSERVITAPFSPLGHDTQIDTEDRHLRGAPDQPAHPSGSAQPPGFEMSGEEMSKLMNETNMEQPFHPLYNYALVTDSEEGLILSNVNTLADREPRNNFLERALTWNENGILNGARHITIGGHFAYIAADAGLVILDLDDPLAAQGGGDGEDRRHARQRAAVPLPVRPRRHAACASWT